MYAEAFQGNTDICILKNLDGLIDGGEDGEMDTCKEITFEFNGRIQVVWLTVKFFPFFSIFEMFK